MGENRDKSENGIIFLIHKYKKYQFLSGFNSFTGKILKINGLQQSNI